MGFNSVFKVLSIFMYFNEVNILDQYSVEWKSACVGALSNIELKNARWNIEITNGVSK